MSRDSNRHTFLFAGVMVITIAFVLSFTSESLKDLKVDNIKKEIFLKKINKAFK